MGKKKSNMKATNAVVRSVSLMTLREESSGRRKTNINTKSMLKLEHVHNIALWATGEAFVLPLGAFFGRRLASLGEALGSQPDPSLITCEKCESVLQPGHNCTVRIENNITKKRRIRKEHNISPQNYVVYMCHICSLRNIKRGTPRHHMNTICPPNPKPFTKSVKLNEVRSTDETASIAGNRASPRISGILCKPKRATPCLTSCICLRPPMAGDPSTPLVRTDMTLLEAKSKKRTRSKKKVNQCDSDYAKIDDENFVDMSSKRKRRSWTSFKELAKRSGRENFVDMSSKRKRKS